MRLKLTLRQLKPLETLPINTGYVIGSAIYQTLSASSTTFATQLHNEGYANEHQRQKFKLFTFSNLEIPKREIERNRIISKSPEISFLISSPKEDFLEHLIAGLFQDGMLRLAGCQFEKSLIEALPDPEFHSTMNFMMLSPLTLSVQEEGDRGKSGKYYLRHNDPRLATLLKENILAKYQMLHQKPFSSPEFDFQITFNKSFIDKQRKRGKRIEKLITIAEGTERETKVKAILCPFTISAPPELIKIGYECGFGENNAMGFGMVKEMIDDK